MEFGVFRIYRYKDPDTNCFMTDMLAFISVGAGHTDDAGDGEGNGFARTDRLPGLTSSWYARAGAKRRLVQRRMAKWAVGDQENVAAAITMSKLPWFAFAPLNFVSTFFRSIGQHLLVNNIIRLEQVNGPTAN